MHQPQLRQFAPSQLLGNGADRDHLAMVGRHPQRQHVLRGLGGVGDRLGVGHREDGGEPAARGGTGSGLHSFRVLTSGFTQMGMQVHQPRQCQQPVRINHGRPDGMVLREPARLDEEIRPRPIWKGHPGDGEF